MDDFHIVAWRLILAAASNAPCVGERARAPHAYWSASLDHVRMCARAAGVCRALRGIVRPMSRAGRRRRETQMALDACAVMCAQQSRAAMLLEIVEYKELPHTLVRFSAVPLYRLDTTADLSAHSCGVRVRIIFNTKTGCSYRDDSDNETLSRALWQKFIKRLAIVRRNGARTIHTVTPTDILFDPNGVATALSLALNRLPLELARCHMATDNQRLYWRANQLLCMTSVRARAGEINDAWTVLNDDQRVACATFVVCAMAASSVSPWRAMCALRDCCCDRRE